MLLRRFLVLNTGEGKKGEGKMKVRMDEDKLSPRSSYAVHAHGIPESKYLADIARAEAAKIQVANQNKINEGDPDPNEGREVRIKATQ